MYAPSQRRSRVKLSRVFQKLISSVLVFTFSYTQLLYAADVRQMLLDAKMAFLEEDQRRAMTSDDLLSSQSTQESMIDQQNVLQSLEGPMDSTSLTTSFSLTTQNGDILKYVGDRLSQVQRPDGTLLNNIQLGSDGNILNADLRLSDGSIQVFQDGKVLGYKTPDGTDVEYDLTTGKILKTTSKDGLLTTTYTYAPSGETILDNVSYKTTYDSQGKLKEVLSKLNSQKTLYSQGMLQKIVRPDNSEFSFK